VIIFESDPIITGKSLNRAHASAKAQQSPLIIIKRTPGKTYCLYTVVLHLVKTYCLHKLLYGFEVLPFSNAQVKGKGKGAYT